MLQTFFHGGLWSRPRSAPWNGTSPVREELFGVERLERHAESLAAAQQVTTRPPPVRSLQARLSENAAALLAAYRICASDLESGRGVVPAAEWLLDNYHLVEEQIREVRADLPPGYYRQLPKLADGPFVGYPRVFGLAWAFVAHTDSHIDLEILRRFIAAYQQVQPLTIGELWAVAITLRIVLIENLRRLADQIVAGRGERADADRLADRLLESGGAQSALDADIGARLSAPLSEVYAAQLAKRLRDQDPRTTPALGLLAERLRLQESSIEDVVQNAQHRLGASNVSVRNVITSMRLISDIDWADLFESLSLVDKRLRVGSAFAAMDFPTRNLYRSAIEELARGSLSSEIEVAEQVLLVSSGAAAQAHDPKERERVGDPGYHLIAEGRRAFERTIGFKPGVRLRISRLSLRPGIIGYVGVILSVTAALLALGLWTLSALGLDANWVVLFALWGFLPTTEVATALVNRAITWSFGATTLPGLELAEGVPKSFRTLIAVPTLLTNEVDLMEQVDRLEVHYLAGSGGDLTFALLSDGVDADREIVASDAHPLGVAAEAIARLNRHYGPGPDGDRFLLLHRRRVFNARENVWMGWERKRGKLHELNRLLRGAPDTTFVAVAGKAPRVPDNVRFVITLDADTRLPRDAARRLVGKMAHPVNRPQFSERERRVISGYAIIQPRVTPALPLGREGSVYQRVSSGPAGIDPYAAAISDVYQDLFGEGTYTGKGIYDVDAFEAALAGRVPDNALLSHDLFEGVFARAGLASDIEVVEEFPNRYNVAAKRQHRWVRGDWQLLPWIVGRGGTMPLLGRLRMLDNLRRSLLAPTTLMAVVFCWLLPMPAAIVGLLLVLATVAIPAFLPSVFSVLPRRAGLRVRNHLGALAGGLRLAAAQTSFTVAFLPDHAQRAADAIARTLLRLFVTRRHLLEWTTAAKSTAAARLGMGGFYRGMAGGVVLGLALASLTLAAVPASWPLVLPFVLLWACAPALAFRISRAPPIARRLSISPADATDLRLIARRTWRYFETFVTPDDNMLPPDNFQEDPKPALAHRTSSTNIGLYLLSAVAARDFGWAGTTETVERLEATLGSMRKLAQFKGHFFNWYDTRDLRPLDPAYVSSVDSGNLAGHLIALANACEEWMDPTCMPDARVGMNDALRLAREAAEALPTNAGGRGHSLFAAFDDIETRLNGAEAIERIAASLNRLTEKAAAAARSVTPISEDCDTPDLLFWIGALKRIGLEFLRDRPGLADPARPLNGRLKALANTAREMALAMDFAFLLDPDRKLLSIGYSLADNGLDSSCYDLLASEARLASLFAIAKGDVPTKHWFRLGRAVTPLGGGAALVSWSGSMFEYLMPSLVMRAPDDSLLGQTGHLVVKRQQAYGRSLGVPWGVSESAYNARDIEFTYQYSNFGVPGLGLKRGLSANAVIAPYATALAAMVDPAGAEANYVRLAAMGARGRYGFYESLDFTRSRLPAGENVAIVRAFMAHHQGMTIVAIANTLDDGCMRARFHREPMIKASELLLQERIPMEVAIVHPRAEEVKSPPPGTVTEAVTVRRLSASTGGPPVTHLLSNGRYAVMLTATGGGYSRWRDIAVTRWREDTTRDNWGSFLFLKDGRSGKIWSVGARSDGSDADHDEVFFGEDHAQFVHRDGSLTTTTDILVLSEDDGEVRRVSLTNKGGRPREIEITSYAEVVLAAPAADNAHPAFSKLFVQTEHLPEFDALLATRRPRSNNEPRLWVAHFAVVEGEVAADPQYETDRARFLGRGRAVADATAILDGHPLSKTVGTVLDPIFSLRQRVMIQPGKIARVAFWTVAASSRDELLGLIDKNQDRSAFDRARTLAWTKGQVQLRHLGIATAEAADFQRLAAPILYADPRFRVPSEAIQRGAGAQSGLWPYAISGDLPIVVLRIYDIEDMAQIAQLLRAHVYWRMKRLAVDLVIVNEHAASYMQDLQIAIETAVRSSQSRPRVGDVPAQGAVYALRADLMNAEARSLLHAVARVVLHAYRGTLADQLARLRPPSGGSLPLKHPKPRAAIPAAQQSAATLATAGLEFFNGLGGFDKDGREYVTVLDGERLPPAPWINVIANSCFGFQVSTEGAGYTWAGNSRENQLTQWSNDPVSDPPVEAMYVRDEVTGDLWSPTAQPIRDGGLYVARHGFGYSRFEHEANGIALELLQFVPLSDPVKISRLTLSNRSGRARRLSITAYAEWVLGTSRGASAPFIVTEIDAVSGAILARNPWSTAFPGRIAFADLGGRQTAWTADRAEFVGHNGALEAPAALVHGGTLSGAVGAGFDPCAALATSIELGAGETTEIVWLLGQCGSVEDARELIARTRETDLDTVLASVADHWETLLGAVRVKTPDRTMDLMLNGWLLYQTLACRVLARSAFYQASGAYGFRDQLQDTMALSFAAPDETRRHLLRAAARQFIEGDVQHWWLPHSGQGVRTRISDDRVWLAFAAATYITASGDTAVLDEVVPFLEGAPLGGGEHDAFFQPMIANERASLFEHCARGLDQCLDLTGEHGLPLIGTGDWNDGMNRVGEDGRGESVWLGWLLVRTIALFAPFADSRGPGRADRWRTHAASVQAAIEREAWDGEWYRRATFDDGTWLGSKESEECRIDSIAQSWAVLSETSDSEHAARAMAALDRHLIRHDDGLVLLFTPPFDTTPRDPGYIKGYPPGLRENGGQYSHAAMWAIMAFAKLGEGACAVDLFSLANPINHARTLDEVERYKVEPYVVAADVYSVPPHTGRGGWTWYTGSAAWMYRAGVESILGIRREGAFLVIAPCIPSAWPGFEAAVKVASTHYDICVRNLPGAGRNVVQADLDGEPVGRTEGVVHVPLDGKKHVLAIILGADRFDL
ncbi:GH36-type glycosyl hydrolase domain-containing protein [Nitrobacter sp. TKz-YC02]|uniref:GH36-type glycosyl hydrolase domain-containing protein n=1 Tax=Nitrobacter sp. TKz-YC02 TaxID=3398704 RepID=UPI003CEB6478